MLVAILAVVLYVWRGRAPRNQKLHELSWILAVSQLAVVLVPALALVLTALAVFAARRLPSRARRARPSCCDPTGAAER